MAKKKVHRAKKVTLPRYERGTPGVPFRVDDARIEDMARPQVIPHDDYQRQSDIANKRFQYEVSNLQGYPTEKYFRDAGVPFEMVQKDGQTFKEYNKLTPTQQRDVQRAADYSKYGADQVSTSSTQIGVPGGELESIQSSYQQYPFERDFVSLKDPADYSNPNLHPGAARAAEEYKRQYAEQNAPLQLPTELRNFKDTSSEELIMPDKPNIFRNIKDGEYKSRAGWITKDPNNPYSKSFALVGSPAAAQSEKMLRDETAQPSYYKGPEGDAPSGYETDAAKRQINANKEYADYAKEIGITDAAEVLAGSHGDKARYLLENKYNALAESRYTKKDSKGKRRGDGVDGLWDYKTDFPSNYHKDSQRLDEDSTGYYVKEGDKYRRYSRTGSHSVGKKGMVSKYTKSEKPITKEEYEWETNKNFLEKAKTGYEGQKRMYELYQKAETGDLTDEDFAEMRKIFPTYNSRENYQDEEDMPTYDYDKDVFLKPEVPRKAKLGGGSKSRGTWGTAPTEAMKKSKNLPRYKNGTPGVEEGKYVPYQERTDKSIEDSIMGENGKITPGFTREQAIRNYLELQKLYRRNQAEGVPKYVSGIQRVDVPDMGYDGNAAMDSTGAMTSGILGALPTTNNTSLQLTDAAADMTTAAITSGKPTQGKYIAGGAAGGGIEYGGKAMAAMGGPKGMMAAGPVGLGIVGAATVGGAVAGGLTAKSEFSGDMMRKRIGEDTNAQADANALMASEQDALYNNDDFHQIRPYKDGTMNVGIPRYEQGTPMVKYKDGTAHVLSEVEGGELNVDTKTGEIISSYTNAPKHSDKGTNPITGTGYPVYLKEGTGIIKAKDAERYLSADKVKRMGILSSQGDKKEQAEGPMKMKNGSASVKIPKYALGDDGVGMGDNWGGTTLPEVTVNGSASGNMPMANNIWEAIRSGQIQGTPAGIGAYAQKQGYGHQALTDEAAAAGRGDQWYGGSNAENDLTNFGPTTASRFGVPSGPVTPNTVTNPGPASMGGYQQGNINTNVPQYNMPADLPFEDESGAMSVFQGAAGVAPGAESVAGGAAGIPNAGAKGLGPLGQLIPMGYNALHAAKRSEQYRATPVELERMQAYDYTQPARAAARRASNVAKNVGGTSTQGMMARQAAAGQQLQRTLTGYDNQVAQAMGQAAMQNVGIGNQETMLARQAADRAAMQTAQAAMNKQQYGRELATQGGQFVNDMYTHRQGQSRDANLYANDRALFGAGRDYWGKDAPFEEYWRLRNQQNS